MNKPFALTLGISLPASAPVHAINAKYRQPLERSGCAQVTEAQGCDITKTKAENAKAGFVKEAPAGKAAATEKSPYTG